MSTEQQLRETERFFYEQIPLTRAMEVRVESYDGERLVLTAPLAANHNHLGTAFGGSLGAVAMTAGYGLLWLELGGGNLHIVIRESTASFRRPVRGEIRAVCVRPGETAIAAFKAAFASKGKARLKLTVTIEEEGKLAVAFEGTYVALKSAPPKK